MMGLYVQARTLYHALTSDKDPILTKEEAEKEPNASKIQRAKEARERHDAEWFGALASPQHFGQFLHMEHILGEPAQSVKTAQELRAEEAQARRNEAMQLKDRIVAGFRRRN